MKIRPVEKSDNNALRLIIEQVMTEFKADPKTTILGDPARMTMYENYQEERSFYFVAEEKGKIIGGAGIKKLDGSDGSVCELQRMFLLPDARGKGTGKELIQRCIEKARDFSYKTIYLESLGNMSSAILLYQKSGFSRIPNPIGKTGHGGCDVFMTLSI
jgi:putative acetyltransferase